LNRSKGVEIMSAQATLSMARLPIPQLRFRPSSWTAIRAAFFTLGAAAIHAAVMPQHFQEYTLFGVFFLAAALGQAGLAAALLFSPSRLLAILGIEGNLALVALWLISRTVGVPIGPDPWRPETVGVADTAATVLELVAVWNLIRLARGQVTPGGSSLRFRLRPVLALLPGLLLTIVGVEGGTEAMPASVNMSAPVLPRQSPTPMNSLVAAQGDEPVRSFTLVAEPAHIAGQTAWTFNGTVPGPELRVTQGDRVLVTLINHLPLSTTIHWHGVPVPNAEDGVAGVTQNAVLPGFPYTYEFVARDAGTFWYHSHQDTANQLTRGLFGALVVEPRGGQIADRDYTLIFHEFPGQAIISPGLLGLAGYVRQAFSGQSVAVNGVTGDLRLEAQPGERVRLRLIGALEGEQYGPLMMIGQPLELVVTGTCYQVVALDGNDLNAPQCIGPQRLRLGIGQRYDLQFVVPASGSVRILDTHGHERVIVGGGPALALSDWSRLLLFDPLRYGRPAPDPITEHGFDVTYQVVLGEEGGIRNLQPELIHTINGKAAPIGTVYLVRTGQVVRLHIVNHTDEYHVMHLHGHAFIVLARNGQATVGSPVYLDSLLVGPNETWDVAFLANNPGLWMFHCHVLLHAAIGMSAMVSYYGVTTPYDIGQPFGNEPE
jgi:FtsP/CotA-like multicopper oxidase with cupredoxin domain